MLFDKSIDGEEDEEEKLTLVLAQLKQCFNRWFVYITYCLCVIKTIVVSYFYT